MLLLLMMMMMLLLLMMMMMMMLLLLMMMMMMLLLLMMMTMVPFSSTYTANILAAAAGEKFSIASIQYDGEFFLMFLPTEIWEKM